MHDYKPLIIELLSHLGVNNYRFSICDGCCISLKNELDVIVEPSDKSESLYIYFEVIITPNKLNYSMAKTALILNTFESAMNGYIIALNDAKNAFFVYKNLPLFGLKTQSLIDEFSNTYKAWSIVNQLLRGQLSAEKDTDQHDLPSNLLKLV